MNLSIKQGGKKLKKLHPQLTEYEFDKEMQAFSTTRKGGVSKGSYDSFNINHYCGDNEEDIRRNREILCDELHIADECLIMPHQVHDTKILAIGTDFMKLSREDRTARLEGVDGLITSLKGVCIGVSTADCIPILLYNKDRHITGAIHAGWRGTVARIVKTALEEMQRHYAIRPEELSAIIGPGIALESFEVGNEVYDQFKAAGFPMPLIAEQFPAQAPYTQKWHIDLWEANRIQLIEAGVERERICIAGIDTYRHADEYFSARRLGIKSGRIFTGILFPNTDNE